MYRASTPSCLGQATEVIDQFALDEKLAKQEQIETTHCVPRTRLNEPLKQFLQAEDLPVIADYDGDEDQQLQHHKQKKVSLTARPYNSSQRTSTAINLIGNGTGVGRNSQGSLTSRNNKDKAQFKKAIARNGTHSAMRAYQDNLRDRYSSKVSKVAISSIS